MLSKHSRLLLEEVDPKLKALFLQVANSMHCQVLCGYRSSAEQEDLFKAGRTKVRGGKSKHNNKPSLAVDVAPLQDKKLIWPDSKAKGYLKQLAYYYYFAGVVLGTAETMGLKIRWGGNWDGDDTFLDQTFDDLVHFELKD